MLQRLLKAASVSQDETYSHLGIEMELQRLDLLQPVQRFVVVFQFAGNTGEVQAGPILFWRQFQKMHQLLSGPLVLIQIQVENPGRKQRIVVIGVYLYQFLEMGQCQVNLIPFGQ